MNLGQTANVLAKCGQLEERRDDIRAKIKEHANRFKNVDYKPTQEDADAFDSLEREFDAVNAEITSLRSQRLGRDGGRIGVGGSGSQSIDLQNKAVAGWARNGFGLPIPQDEYDASLALNMSPVGNAFEIALPECRPQIGLVRNSQSSRDGTQGGYTIQPGFVARLESALMAYSGMMQASEIWITADGVSTSWPTCDDTSNTGAQIGENAESTELELTFGAQVFNAYKMTSKLVKAPYELLRDSSLNLAGEIGAKLGERLGRIVNTKATTGTGAATLSGIVNDCTVGKTAASATAIAFDELIELQHSVDPAYRAMPGVGWIFNDSTASVLRRLKDGDGRYLWQDAVIAGQPPTLLGYKVVINQDVASIATGTKSVLFGDLAAYKLRIVGKVRLRTLVERYAEFDQTGFLGFLEVDGKLLKPSATASLCPVRCIQMA